MKASDGYLGMTVRRRGTDTIGNIVLLGKIRSKVEWADGTQGVVGWDFIEPAPVDQIEEGDVITMQRINSVTGVVDSVNTNAITIDGSTYMRQGWTITEVKPRPSGPMPQAGDVFESTAFGNYLIIDDETYYSVRMHEIRDYDRDTFKLCTLVFRDGAVVDNPALSD